MYQLRSISAAQKGEGDRMKAGVWLRWQALTLGERFVSANIICIPIWWVLGLYEYLPFLLLAIVAAYEVYRYGKLRLTNPQLPVIALLTFGMYQLGRLLVLRVVYFQYGTITISDILILSFCPAIWLWYIQSNNIKIRLEVVAWACMISVLQIFVFWVLLQFVIPDTVFWPARLRTVSGILTGRGVGEANKNFYLLPFLPRTLVADFNRFSFFFIFPEFFAVFVGFISLVALELKSRWRSFLLLIACVFLLFLSATRMVWVALPLVIGLRYLFIALSKRWGTQAVLFLIAIASFVTFSMPPATDAIIGKFTNSIQAVNEVRADSSEVRFEIYRQTWLGIQEDPFWGYMSKGEAISATSTSSVGSHSAILGSLLYRTGVIGTLMFTVFWVSLLLWLYETRADRPLLPFCMMSFYTLAAPTLALVYDMPISSLLILLSIAIGQREVKSQKLKVKSQKLA